MANGISLKILKKKIMVTYFMSWIVFLHC